MAAQVKRVPLRKCTGCQEMKNKKDMIRIIHTAEDEILLDLTGKKNGRGAYICPTMDCFMKAQKNKGLERSLKCRITQETYDGLKKEIESIEAR